MNEHHGEAGEQFRTNVMPDLGFDWIPVLWLPGKQVTF